MQRLVGRTILGVLTVVALAACTSGEGDRPLPSPATSDNGVASLPAADILKQAIANAKVQTSVHIRGSGSCPDSQFFADMRLRNDGQGTGTVKFTPFTLQVVSTPTKLYVNAPRSFWATQTSTASADRIGDKWVESDVATNPCLAALSSFTNLLANYLGYPGTPVKQKSFSIYGVPAQLVSVPPDVSIWVRTKGTPLPVRVDQGSTKTGMSMGEWSAPVEVTIPAPADVIDSRTIKPS